MGRVDILRDLNLQQRQAVEAPTGAVLVLAGPGSGKTRVLIHRIAYLINHLGVPAYQILAVTFTNKAAKSMSARLETILDGRPQGIWMGTFHSICARILRREATRYLPLDANFVIFDDDDQLALIKRILRDFNLDDKVYRPRGVLSAISSAKNEMIHPQDYEKEMEKSSKRDLKRGMDYERKIARVYQQYQKQLLESNAVDFDDLLLRTYDLFNENPDALAAYSRQFVHILVDEFQDTNQVQYKLVSMLASDHGNLFVVGDEDQSIYRWRGADYRNVQRFEEDYPNVEKILLEQNYRSTQIVLDTAVAVIDHNQNRTRKELRAVTGVGHGEKVLIHAALDDRAEAGFVVETIQRLVHSGEAGLGDFAIMYRTNAQSRAMEEGFMRAQMQYRLVGAQRFYGRAEVKDLIAYFRLVQNPADQISLARVINVPRRKIGEKTLQMLLSMAQEMQVGTGKILFDLAEQGQASVYWAGLQRAAAALADFGGKLAAWHTQAPGLMIVELFDSIVHDISFDAYLQDEYEDADSRWENVQQLRGLAADSDENGLGLTQFLENIALISDQDTVADDAEVPTLLTLHAAKGLEFPIVFIIGMDDGLLPHSRAISMESTRSMANKAELEEEMAEERRLFYVGLTRAKKRLYLVRAETRYQYGSSQAAIPSRFLADIPKELLKPGSVQVKTRRSLGWDDIDSYAADSTPAYNWNARGTSRSGGGSASAPRRAREDEDRVLHTYHTPPPPSAEPPAEPRYRAAMHVRHGTWGEGLVIESRMQDGDERVDVVFQSVGLKRLVASLANLEILPDKQK